MSKLIARQFCSVLIVKFIYFIAHRKVFWNIGQARKNERKKKRAIFFPSMKKPHAHTDTYRARSKNGDQLALAPHTWTRTFTVQRHKIASPNNAISRGPWKKTKRKKARAKLGALACVCTLSHNNTRTHIFETPVFAAVRWVFFASSLSFFFFFFSFLASCRTMVFVCFFFLPLFFLLFEWANRLPWSVVAAFPFCHNSANVRWGEERERKGKKLPHPNFFFCVRLGGLIVCVCGVVATQL